jgi:hypothetical protein
MLFSTQHENVTEKICSWQIKCKNGFGRYFEKDTQKHSSYWFWSELLAEILAAGINVGGHYKCYFFSPPLPAHC